MPQIMEPCCFRQPGLPEDRLEVANQVTRLDRCTKLRREYQTMLVPGVTCLPALYVLTCPVRLEDPREHGGQRKHAMSSFSFCVAPCQLSVLALQCAGYGQRPRFEIDIIPPQPQHLSTSQSEREGDPIQGLQSVPAYRIQ